MQHLNEEQLVMHRYRDEGDDAASAEQHLSACADCRAQYDTLCRVLALVDELPVPERGDDYGTAVWNRLRWRLGRRERARMWQGLAAAAMVALVFLAGVWWARMRSTKADHIASNTAQMAAQAAGHDRILVMVVGDHLDNSERMLLEISNADSSRPLDVSGERRRAAELVSQNRLYRQTATQRGDERIATLLADLEPVLVELAHADDHLSAAELTSLQKRIDSKELLFKVRVVSAQAGGHEAPRPLPKGTNSL
jgi:hypothetical protein